MRKFLIFFCAIMFTSHVLAASAPGWYNTNKRITITCDHNDKVYRQNCSLENNHNLEEVVNCAKISGDPFNNNNIIYITNIDQCPSRLSTVISKSKCPYVDTVRLDPAGSYLIYCVTNKNVTLKNVNRLSDSWTQEHKNCVSSGGNWENDACDCSKLPGTKNIENECICTNTNQKYYNGSSAAAGCETLKDGVENPQGIPQYGFYQDLSNEDKRTSCGISGGEWGGINNNVCECKKSPNMERDSSGYFCNCKQGYKYIDPFFKNMGCTEIDESEQNLSGPSRELESSDKSATIALPADNITITGTVVAADSNETLPGVNIVRIANDGSQTTNGTPTNEDGYFTLAGLNSDESVRFSFVGFKTLTMKVSDLPKGHSTIKLEPDVINLTEVTVTPNNDDPCTETGGELGDGGACFCDPGKNLSPAVNANFLHICKCTNNTYVYDEITKSCNPTSQEEESEESEKKNDANEGDGVPPIESTQPLITQEDIDAAQQKLTDAQQKLADAREKQNSLGNRLVNAGASAATGYGARMVATAMAEQSADANAESDMREWIDTMKCEYGDGQVFNVGTETIYLPGGDEISEYAKEYKNMAGELKKTKAALGLKPGIESETIYDRADYDLYSYNPAERQSSGNVSVSRALMDSTSEDAIAWAEQKQESEQNRKIGTGVAIGGAAVGVIGNTAINTDAIQKIKNAFKKD